jgi:hypothetical protein
MAFTWNLSLSENGIWIQGTLSEAFQPKDILPTYMALLELPYEILVEVRLVPSHMSPLS